MNSPNSHVEVFLDYYCNLKTPPEYAVLLKGQWGCGKTWYIKNYFKKLRENNKKYLYVSLYGVTSYSEIENLFFQQLHPLLSDKRMALAGKILKGTLKAAIKIDIDGDGKSDATATSEIPNIKFPEYLSNADGNILVFDDLERCKIDKLDVLGYINHFVEHQGFKVIIIANEEDIISKENQDDKTKTSFKKAQEKLIGKSFEIIPCFRASFMEFEKGIERKEIKDLFKKQYDIIEECYTASGYKNLRYLKQSLWDLERFCSVIPSDKFLNDGFCLDLLRFFLILSFEIKASDLKPEEICKISQGYVEDIWRDADKEQEPSVFQKITEKYKFISFYEPLFPHQIWENFFAKGIVDTDNIIEALKRSKYFSENTDNNWAKLWHYYEMDDNEFDELFSSVQKEIAKKTHKEVGIVLHIFGMFLNFSDLGIIDDDKKTILKNGRDYLNYLRENNLILQSDYTTTDYPFGRDGWGSLGFSGSKLEEFKELLEYLDVQIGKAKVDALPEKAEELLALMDNSVEDFYRLLTESNSINIFTEFPVLSKISQEIFADKFLEISPKNRRVIAKCFAKRFEYPETRSKLVEEKKWLEVLKNILIEKRKKEGRLKGYTIEVMITHGIDPALNFFKRDS